MKTKTQKLTPKEFETLKEAVKSRAEVQEKLEPAVQLFTQLQTNEKNIVALLAERYNFDAAKGLSIGEDGTITVAVSDEEDKGAAKPGAKLKTVK